MDFMKIFLLLFGLFFISCTPIRYLSKPLYQSPSIGLEENLRILIAKDKLIMSKIIESDKCFEGILLNSERYKQINIVEIIDFHRKVDSTILMQLKEQYKVVGLLLLTDISEKPFNTLKEGLSQACAGCPKNYSLEYENHITSVWEYFDFKTGKTHGFNIRNSKSGKQHLSIHEQEEINFPLFLIKEQLLVENGKRTIEKLIGLELKE